VSRSHIGCKGRGGGGGGGEEGGGDMLSY